MNTQNVVVWTLSGLVAGTAVGMLTAPFNGRDTRQKISDTANGIKTRYYRMRGYLPDELRDLKNTFENHVDGLSDEIRQRVLKLIDISKKSYHPWKQETIMA